MHRHDTPKIAAVCAHSGKADQIDVVELVVSRRGQPLARHEQLNVGETLGGITIIDTAKPSDQMALGGS
jgi:hypothetical protein